MMPVKNNQFIKVLYMLLVLGMFTFFILLARHQWAKIQPEPLSYATNPSRSSESGSGSISTPQSGAVTTNPNYLTGFWVTGVQTDFDLNQDIKHVISDLWTQLLNNELSQELAFHLPDLTMTSDIYLVFHDIDEVTMKAQISLGYQSAKQINTAQLKTTKVNSGSYIEYASVWKAWSHPQHIPHPMSYTTDFEVFSLKSGALNPQNMNHWQQTAFVGIELQTQGSY